MSIVLDKIAEFTAQEAKLVSTPAGDLGFGSNLSCTDDLTSDAAELAGDDPLVVAQSNYRRLTSPLGSNPDDPNYGLDIREYLNRGVNPRSITELAGAIRAELAKDDRNEMDSITVTVTPSLDLKSFDVDIRSEAADAPYTLTLAVTDAGVLLKEINGAS